MKEFQQSLSLWMGGGLSAHINTPIMPNLVWPSLLGKRLVDCSTLGCVSRHDNGITPEEVIDDIPPEHLEQLKTSFYSTKVFVTKDEAMEIEKQTRDQADSMQWLVERRKRLTASKVGGISKMKNSTKNSKKVQNLLYSTFRGNEATRYGSEKEEETTQQYINHQRKNGHPDLSVDKSGLSISLTNPWLAASPDGTVHDPSDTDQGLGLVEVKNPYSMRGKSLAEACKSSTFCLANKHDTYELKPRHDYFYQMQCYRQGLVRFRTKD